MYKTCILTISLSSPANSSHKKRLPSSEEFLNLSNGYFHKVLEPVPASKSVNPFS